MEGLEDWEKRLMNKFANLEDWEKKYVEQVKDEIKKLISEKNELLENLRNIEDLFEKYSTYWNLKVKFEQLKHKFSILQRWSHVNFNIKIYNFLCDEIYYFELCFSMLKNKRGAKNVDFRHFLNAAELEYEYLIEKNYELPHKFLEAGFELEGDTDNPKLNLVINNIKNAQKNLGAILEQKEREENHKDLFLFYEVMGDLYIHIYILLNKYENLVPNKKKENMKNAYYYYLRSFENKGIFVKTEGNYRTHYDGLHGWPCLGIFVNFYNNIGVTSVHDVKLKLDHLKQEKFLKKNEIQKLEEKLKVDIYGD